MALFMTEGKSHLAKFDQICEADNYARSLLPDHSPKIDNCLISWTCGKVNLNLSTRKKLARVNKKTIQKSRPRRNTQQIHCRSDNA